MLETFVVKMIAMLGTLLPGTGHQVELSQPVVELRQDRIAVSCVVQHPISDDLLNLINSGTPVTLSFVCRLRTSDGTPTVAPDTVVAHKVVMDLATGTYEVSLGDRSLLASRFNENSQYFRLETVTLWPASDLAEGVPFVVEVSARLEPIEIHASGEQYDLMAFWNYHEPRGRSATFTSTSIVRRQVSP